MIGARREVLAARLLARGRESAAEVDRRLSRQVPPLPTGLPVVHVDNSGALEDGIAAFLDALQPVRA